MAEPVTDLRRLDALLAEHLFGWELRVVGSENRQRWWKENEGWYHFLGGEPRWSSTYEGMGLVLEAMAKRRWHYCLQDAEPWGETAFAEFFKAGQHNDARCVGDSLPEAVARAALAAL